MAEFSDQPGPLFSTGSGFPGNRTRDLTGLRKIDGAYIEDLTSNQKGQKFHFQFMPTEISDSKSANWSSTEILGRSEPIQGYAASSPRVISLTFELAESVDQHDVENLHGEEANTPGGNTEVFPADYVLDRVAFLQSLVYPDYDSQIVKPPPVCLLIVGQTIRSRVICKDVQTSWKGPWEPESLTPMFATVQCTFEEVNEGLHRQGPWGHTQVRKRENWAAGSSAGVNHFEALI